MDKKGTALAEYIILGAFMTVGVAASVGAVGKYVSNSYDGNAGDFAQHTQSNHRIPLAFEDPKGDPEDDDENTDEGSGGSNPDNPDDGSDGGSGGGSDPSEPPENDDDTPEDPEDKNPEQDDEDDGNNGHGNDDEGDDDSNPGNGGNSDDDDDGNTDTCEAKGKGKDKGQNKKCDDDHDNGHGNDDGDDPDNPGNGGGGADPDDGNSGNGGGNNGGGNNGSDDDDDEDFVSPHEDKKVFGIDEDYSGTITFLGEDAGFRSSIGLVKIAENGDFTDAQIIFGNASQEDGGGDLIPGQSTVDIDISAGDQIAFFIVSNGYSKNGDNISADGEYVFMNEDYDTANINETDPISLYRVEDGGSSYTKIKSQYDSEVYFSISNIEADFHPNPDGFPHSVGYVDTESGQLTVGFEDLKGGGDKDYNDFMLQFDIGQSNAEVLAPHLEYDEENFEGYQSWVDYVLANVLNVEYDDNANNDGDQNAIDDDNDEDDASTCEPKKGKGKGKGKGNNKDCDD